MLRPARRASLDITVTAFISNLYKETFAYAHNAITLNELLFIYLQHLHGYLLNDLVEKKP